MPDYSTRVREGGFYGMTPAAQRELKLERKGTNIVINSGKLHGNDPKEMNSEELDVVRRRMATNLKMDLSSVSDEDIRVAMIAQQEGFRDNAPVTAAEAGAKPAPGSDGFSLRQALVTPAFWLVSLGHASALLVVGAVMAHLFLHLTDSLGYADEEAARLAREPLELRARAATEVERVEFLGRVAGAAVQGADAESEGRIERGRRAHVVDERVVGAGDGRVHPGR